MVESLFSMLEADLLSRRRLTFQAKARLACFSYNEGWYNPDPLHSSLSYWSPMTYEAEDQATLTEPYFTRQQTVHENTATSTSIFTPLLTWPRVVGYKV